MGTREYLRADWSGAPHRPFWATYPVTKALLIGLPALHVAMLLLISISRDAGYAVWFFLRLEPHAVLHDFKVWQLVTGALLHDLAHVTHILVNCIVLFFFGRIVELKLGTRRYLLFLLGSVLTASLGYLVFAVFRSQVTAMVGFSGATMGLLVLATLWNPHMEVLFFFVLRMRLWVLALILVGLDVVGVLSASGDIANAAHLGGALYAWVYWKWGGRFGRVFEAIDRAADERRRRAQTQRAQRDAELRREIDRILDKVNREGMAALTSEERRFLKRASDKLRR